MVLLKTLNRIAEGQIVLVKTVIAAVLVIVGVVIKHFSNLTIKPPKNI